MLAKEWRAIGTAARRLFFSPRYESPAMLRQCLRSQWGPYLKQGATSVSEDFYQAIIGCAARFLPLGGRVLDVGCATGRLVVEFERLGAREAIGIDQSVRMIRWCNRMKRGQTEFTLVPSAAKCSFLVGDILNDAVGDSFDFVSCINVLDRVMHPRHLIERLGEILAPGGTALIVTPYDWTFSPAPLCERVDDAKALLNPTRWVILEERWMPYTMLLNDGPRTFRCHMLVAKRIR